MKITKKLRDVTREEYIEWTKNNCATLACGKCLFECVKCSTFYRNCWVSHKDLFIDKFLDQTIEVEVGDILTKEEKEYLSAVIKPFRDKVIDIKKIVLNGEIGKKFIKIGYKEEWGSYSLIFPDLPNDEMYKGMENNRPYKLEELGL